MKEDWRLIFSDLLYIFRTYNLTFCYCNMKLTWKHTPLRYREIQRGDSSLALDRGDHPMLQHSAIWKVMFLKPKPNPTQITRTEKQICCILCFSLYNHLLPPLLPLPSHYYGWATQSKSHLQSEDQNSSSVWGGKEGVNGEYEVGKTRKGA